MQEQASSQNYKQVSKCYFERWVGETLMARGREIIATAIASLVGPCQTPFGQR